jgi:hypothetical protein
MCGRYRLTKRRMLEVEEDAHLRRLLRLEPTFRDCLVSARLDR